jgi:hypothetical protein
MKHLMLYHNDGKYVFKISVYVHGRKNKTSVLWEAQVHCKYKRNFGGCLMLMLCCESALCPLQQVGTCFPATVRLNQRTRCLGGGL